MDLSYIVSIITASIALGTVYLYGCIGETLIEKVGNLNLGIPGIMCLGAYGGGVGVTIYYDLGLQKDSWILLILLGIIFTFIFASLGGLLYAFFTVTLKQNQNVTGLVLTTFGVGVMKFFGKVFDLDNFTKAGDLFRKTFSFKDSLGAFGELFFSYGILVYLAFALAIALGIVLNKTRVGLFLRSIGESPQTADAQGINVNLYKYLSIIIGSSIAGLGGTYYIFDNMSGMTFTETSIDAFGWLALALVIFSMWKPKFGILGSIIFGFLTVLPHKIVGLPLTSLKLFAILPYAITVIVLVLTSILDAKSSKPPQSLGVNYFREER